MNTNQTNAPRTAQGTPAQESAASPDPLAYLGTDPDARQLFKDVNNFIAIIFNMLDDDQRQALYDANPHLWAIQVSTGWHDDRVVWHFGFVLALEELAKHPEAQQQAVQNLRQCLAELLPPPFTVLDELDPEMKHRTIDLIGRLVGKGGEHDD